jgi:hypothetical protein
MTMVKFSDIQDAIWFVSSASYGMHYAILNKETGRLYYRSEMGDLDEISDEDFDWDTCINIPHKKELGLGRDLVFEFVAKYLPDEYDRIHCFFRKRGAYSRYKICWNQKGYFKGGSTSRANAKNKCFDNGVRITR